MVDLRDGVLLPGPGRHPRALPAGPGDRRARACRCSSGSTSARCRRSAGWPSPTTRARSRAEFCTAWSRPGPPPRWSSAPTSPARRRAVHRVGPARAAGHQRPGGQRPRAAGRLLTTPQRAYDEAVALAARWHGVGRNRYAVTPRFSLSASEPMLDACCRRTRRDVGGAGSPRTSTRTWPRSPGRGRLFPALHRLRRHLRPARPARAGAVLAHNVHATDAELAVLAGRGTAVAHCPSSNSALGSGLFPLRAPRRARGPVALGSDVGAGTGFSLLQGGPAGVLHAAAARRRTDCRSRPPTCSTWPPVPAPSRSASATRSATSPSASSSTRSACARPRHRARRRPAPHRERRGGARQDLRARRRRRRGRRLGRRLAADRSAASSGGHPLTRRVSPGATSGGAPSPRCGVRERSRRRAQAQHALTMRSGGRDGEASRSRRRCSRGDGPGSRTCSGSARSAGRHEVTYADGRSSRCPPSMDPRPW